MKTLPGRTQLKGFLQLTLLCTLFFSLNACLTEGGGAEGDTEVVADPTPVPTPLTPPERTVCDPFNLGGSAQDRGLIGNLLFLTDDQPRYTRAVDYIDNGTPVQTTLYFDRLFVPTRAFDLGFYTQDGTLVLNHNNEPIYEYFGLRLESQLMLAQSEAPGWYQMAILSDDGAILQQKNPDGSLSVIVDNDGTHPTRMGCSVQPVYLDHNSKIPVVIEYYQGPRYHISLVVMWRPLPDGTNPDIPVVEAECGRSGNSRYFNSNVVPSAPTTTFYDMLSRGWKPLDNENYYFPEQANNPCAQEDPLLITNFAINSTTRTSVTVSWTTSLPATTRAEVKNVTTGVIISPPEDTVLKTSHTVTVTGLTANTLYSVKGLSVSASGQAAASSESAFRTPR